MDIGVLSVTVLAMLLVGMEMEVSQFRSVSRFRGHLLALVAAQAVVLPAIALAIARLLALQPEVSAGLLVLAACPVGNMANFYVLLARANVPLSVVLNTLSCLLSFATMSAVFKVYSRILGAPFVFPLPGLKLFLWPMLLVAVPVTVGIWLRRTRPGFVGKHLKLMANLCLAGLGIIIVYVLVSQRQVLAMEWRPTAVSAALFMLLAGLAGLSLGAALGFAPAERFTITAAFAVRHVGLAMAIAVTLLNRLEYAAFASVYFITQVLSLLALVASYRRWANWSLINAFRNRQTE